MLELKLKTKSPNKTIKYLKNLNIDIYKATYLDDSIIIKIKDQDYKNIKKYFQVEIINFSGKKYSKIIIQKKIKSILLLTVILILITVMTRVIIDIEVITENKSLRQKILNDLDRKNIKKYTFIKSEKKIQSIKQTILNNNKDTLEWINIQNKGMKYIINIEPKITKNAQQKNEYCNIISKKEAIISRIITAKGQEVKEINDSIKKGDILISGDIKYNEETKKQVCASGTVYGHTWYTINISVPMNHEIITKKEKYRYNIKVKYNNKTSKIFKSRLIEYIEEDKKILNIFGTEIYLVKEIEVNKKITKYNEKEIEKMLSQKILDTIDHNIKGEHKIIEQKVLKKHENNSKIEIEVFIVVEEEISTISKERPQTE